MRNILIMGPMGSGKTTLAGMLANERNIPTSLISFGEKIHNECKIHGKNSREEKQKYGQMMRQIFGDLVWCEYAVKRMRCYPNNLVIIDDGRQLNEYEYFKERGYLTIGIMSAPSPRKIFYKVIFFITFKTKSPNI